VLEYVSTNLFDSPAQTLVNTVNTVGVMGKGIANDFRRLYPEMFERYREFCGRGEFAVGQLYLFRTPHKWVLNFPTKKHWRSPSQLEWVEAGLIRFLETYSQYGITSASFPQLGTGNGGLDWELVRPLMEKYLGQARIPIYVHVRARDPKFVPEHVRPADVFHLSRELHTARHDVTFEQFIADLQNLLGGRPRAPSDAGELPSLEVPDSTGVRVIPGEQILDFWQALRSQGALKLSALPESFREKSLALPEKLVDLDYIKRMDFGAERTFGLRYAPRSQSFPPNSIDVHPE
jgi:O-acetyl-ADP-ribose deacetylase (regulator of RNase III)